VNVTPFAVEWRTEQGAEGVLDVPTVEGQDVACLAYSPVGQAGAVAPWCLTYPGDYRHEARFKSRQSAMEWVVLYARELRAGIAPIGGE